MNGQTPRRILHLGLGAFHRAHQAVYLQDLIDAGDERWELAGGNIRPERPDTAELLKPQGGAYTVETVTPDGELAYRRIEALRTPVPYRPDLAELQALAADPATRILSFTVTEAGYADDTAPTSPTTGHTIYSALIALLRARQRSGAGPVTLLNCDNLRHNGDVVHAGLSKALQRAGEADLLAWVQQHTSCPNGMVDRITPRAPPGLRERVRAATGHDDAAPVMAEHFRQWVIEDRFCNDRPDWARVGVQMVASVLPYEEAKIRLLNAAHSGIAWAGVLRGHRFIHEAARDAAIRRIVHDYATDDAIPCPNGMVDRITPRPPPGLRERVRAATGHDDAAPVMAEHFRQWVIEDRFCNGRPDWARVGVQMVASVLPYEEAKIRLLNAAHSGIAWAGVLRGHRFIHEAARDAAIRRIVHDYATDDAIPCLWPSPVDLAAYRDTVLDRFGNAALQDTVQRVVMDSFAKLPGFIVPTVRERLARGESIASVAMLPALMLAFLGRWHRGELPFAHADSAMDPDRAHAICAAPDVVPAFIREPGLWGALAGAPALEAALRQAVPRVEALVGAG